MNRVKAVRRALDRRPMCTYLEIGVSRGSAFRRIAAAEKIAVGPEFKLSARAKHADASASDAHLRIAVLDCDFGVGIIRRAVPDSVLTYSPAQVEALDYADLAAERGRVLNLKASSYLDKFLASESQSPSKS
jgi:hypothetical protein